MFTQQPGNYFDSSLTYSLYVSHISEKRRRRLVFETSTADVLALCKLIQG